MENKQVTMIRGLVRAAEALEQDGHRRGHGTTIWDDSCRIALEIARSHGWGKHQIGSLPTSDTGAFEQELQRLINAHCQENASGTPDFILASHLQGCLDNWNKSVGARDAWHGFKAGLVLVGDANNP